MQCICYPSIELLRDFLKLIYKQFYYIFTDNGTLQINNLKKKFVLTSNGNETKQFCFC